jgi:ribonuclease T2
MFSSFSRPLIATILVSFTASSWGASCSDPRDSISAYDDTVPARQIRDIPSEYYVLSYSWAPRHCARASEASKRPGEKNFLQCASGQTFGYILHGLWPQGALDGSGAFPRACEGDQPKIPREILKKYLCMTPSLALLQHEYEFHGTCMHDEALETPEAYFKKSLELHSQMVLPTMELANTQAAKDWFHANNAHLAPGSIGYNQRSKEWMFCIGNDFKSIACAGASDSGSTGPTQPTNAQCPVKGNISRNSGRRLYFTTGHRNYSSVRIDTSAGERCFETQAQARAAGWRKAPR